MKKYRGNSGFTMMEMLVAVGILVALMGLGFIAVINYQKSMKQLELDKTSQEIFVAAQNHLTVIKSQGLLEDVGEDKRGVKNEESTDGDQVYCFFVAPNDLLDVQDDVLNLMLPRFSIDDTVRIGGSYAIEYNYKTATVLNVFYSDQSNLSTHTFEKGQMGELFPKLTGEDAKDKRMNYKGTIVGWYGGAGLNLKDPVELKQPEMKILNAEKLQVLFSVDGYKTDTIPDGTMMQVIMHGDTSGSERVLEEGLLFTVLSQSKRVTLDGTTWRYIVLDDITTDGMHFADQWCVEDSTNPANKPFIPGENLTIYAEVYNNKTASRYARSAKKHTNSLFADVVQEKVDDENQNVATISNIRHLENLDASISSYDLNELEKAGAGATRAKQTTNLQWIGGSDAFTNMICSNDKREAGSDANAKNVMIHKLDKTTTERGTYAPVNPKSNGDDYALTYDGGGFKVSNIAIDNTSAAEAGMFGTVTGGELKNMHLLDFKVVTTPGGDAGTLAGKLTNTKVSNVRAYDAQAPSGGTDDRGVTTAGNAGGLVGAFVNQGAQTAPTIADSSASVYVKSTGTGDSASAGGLVGRTTGVTTIEKSYAGAHTVNGAYLDEVPSASNATKVGRLNVQAEVEAGGLVGKAANQLTITNSYATASAYGATVGGLVGSAAANSTVSNSYVTGLVIGKDENAVRGTFAGSAEGVKFSNDQYDQYLAIVSQDVDSTLAERTARAALGSGDGNGIIAADRDLASYQAFYSTRFTSDEDSSNSKQKAAPYDSTLAQDFNNQYPYKSCDELSDAATEAESTHYGDWPKVETKVVNTRSSASVPRAATLRTGHVSASKSFAPKQESVTKRATLNAAKGSANARPMARIGELVNSAISNWLSRVRAEVAGGPAASSSKGDESKDSDAEGDNKPATNSNSSSASSAPNTNDAAAANSSNNSSTAPDTQKQGSPEPSAEVEAPAVEAESAVKVLEKTITSVDGRLYTVRVTYGENANIPDEAELSVKEVNQRPADFFDEDKRDTYKDRPRATELLVDEQNMQDRVSTLTQALELKDGDLLMWNKLLSVNITLDGEVIAPSEDVTVEVETNALPATASDTLEAVTLNNGDANRLAVSNTTGNAKGEAEKKSEELPSRISFTTNVLGDIGLAQVSEEKFAWSMQDNRVYAYGARSVKASPFETATDLKIADDRHIVEVFSIAVDPTHPFDTTLWISAARDGGASRHDSVTGYLVTDDGLKQLFTTVTADGLVPVKAKDTIALVWESGYHQTALKEGSVSVVGEVPEGVTISAEDVYNQYSDPAKLGKEANTPQTKVAAAYTIAMKDAQGAAYKPDAEHPIIASVANLPEYAKDVTVLRVEGNGATKVPSQKQDNGPATFVAADSGTYVVTYTVQAYHKEVKGDTWKVSADYTEEAGIPGDAELVARELSDKEYEAYIKEAAAAVGKDPKDVKVTKAFDISFKKGDTEYHELDKSVRVTIDLADQSIAKGTQVVHMDQEPTVKVSDVKDGNLSFNSSEFSPFLLLQGDGDPAPGEVAINFVNGENVTTVNVPNGQPIGDAIPAGPTKDGYTFKGWYAEGSETPITAQSTFTESTTLSAKFAYTATFAAEGVTPLPNPIEKFEGEAVGTLPTVSKEGYRFDGWYYRIEGEQEDRKAEASTVFTGNTTLTARFVEQVTVTFIADGVQKETKTIDKGTAIGTLPDGTAEGCTFIGWFVEGETEPITAETTFDEKTNVTAHYTVTVTFDVKNADYTQTTSETPETINKGDAIGTKIPGDPVLQGYAFKGWFIEGTDGKPTDQQVSATTTFSAHTRVVAKFVKQVTIAFYDKVDDGDPVLRQKFTVDEGEWVDLIENPNKDGYRFDGWFEETTRRTNALGITDESGNLVDEEGQPLSEGATPVRKIKATRDMNLTSSFVKQITVRFLVVDFVNRSDSTGLPSVNVHYHVNMDETTEGLEIDPFPAEDDNPSMSGYEFQGWYGIKQYPGYEHYGQVPEIDRDAKGVFVLDNNMSGTPYVLDESAPVAKTDKYTSSTDVVAKFTKKVNITFQYDGKQSTVEYLAGENLSAHIPADAPKQGYRLEWYKGDTKVEDGYTVKDEDDNAIFTAHYIEQSTVTFKVGDTEVGTLTIDKGTSVQASGKDWPADPSNPDTSSSAVFIGWYDANNHEYKADSLITTNSLELTAQFGYTVNFFTEDNLTEPFTTPRKVRANAALGWLPTAPYKEGKSFKEWRIGTQVIDETHVVTSNANIVAYYEDLSLYTVIVNYVVDGDSDPTDTKILSVDKSSVAQDPVTVKSPESFKKSNENFYPVAQEIQIVQNGDTIGIAETHSEVRINETSGEDGPIVTITVPYKRADATYTVKHMLLNLNGTESSYNEQNYTEIRSERVEGLIGVQGAFVTPTVKSSILEYANVSKVESGKINHASGDVFYVYYTRKNFTLTYETGDGSGINSVTRPYGTSISLSNETTREGFSFQGWYRTSEAAANLVANQKINGPLTLLSDTTVYAGWKAETVSYSIVYLFEKYNDAGTVSSFVYDSSRNASGTVGSTVWASSAPTITRKGWEKDTTRNNNSSVVIAADGSSVLYVYYKLTEYTFYFRPGVYRWFINNYQYYALDVTAKLNGDTKTGDSNFSYTMTIKLGQDVSRTWPMNVSNASFKYYGTTYRPSFQGWRHPSDVVYVTKRTNVTADMLPDTGNSITYTASWLLNSEEYTVNYWLQNANDNKYTKSEVYSQSINSSAGGINLSAKDIIGYTYNKSKDDHVYSGYGQNRYITTYNFYYDRDTFKIDYYYGSNLLNTISNVKFDATITSNTYNWTPTAAQCGLSSGYTFDGWYSDSGLTSKYTFTTMPASNLVLYAKWIAPEYTVKFHYNYGGAYDPAANDIYEERTVTSGDKAGSIAAPPAQDENTTFVGWFTSRESNEEVKPAGQNVEDDMHLYARWKPTEITQYKVYYQDEAGHDLLDPVTRYGRWPLGEEVSETAPYITGYSGYGFDEDDTLIYDESTKKLTLVANEADNKIVFVYKVKPKTIKYTVKYVLYSDKVTNVADPKTKEVDGSYTNVTETAATPTVAGYTDYYPTEVTKTLELGHDESKNVLTFYYTKGAKITVSYVDMEGDPIPGKSPIETYQEIGEAFNLDTALPGYTFARVEKNGEVTTDTSFTPTKNTEVFDIKVYYKYNLSILARSRSRVYNGEALTDAGTYTNADDFAPLVSVSGLKDGHNLVGITIAGSQTDAGTSPSVASDAVITGFKNGMTAATFYEISYPIGSLTVTPINVTISLEPDRWTGNIYDGEVKMTGFTNSTKAVGDYVKIDNSQFATDHLNNIWDGIKTYLKSNAGAEDYGKLQNDVDGLAVIKGKKDVGDYYEPAGTFEGALASAVSALNLGNNYKVVQYARESHLEILPLPINIKTGAAEKSYDGTPLTNSELTIKAGVEGSQQTITPEEGTTDKFKLTKDGNLLTIKTSGSQTTPGTSLNTYTIDWGSDSAENFSVTEELGELKVTKRAIVIAVQDDVKPLHLADPAPRVKVFYETKDETGNTIRNEIPATLTHWSGDNYTVKLNDNEHGYTDNLPITITRENKSENPGVYEVKAAAGDGADDNYVIQFEPGWLTIAIARVSQNGGPWTYHEYLVNVGTGNQEGAFNRASGLTGNVVLETLCETAEVDGKDRYALPVGQNIRDNQNLTIRTTQHSTWNPSGSGHFQSIISRDTANYGGGSMITLNQATSSLTISDLILDGGSNEGYVLEGGGNQVSGGAVNAKAGKNLLLQNVTVQNSHLCRTSLSSGINANGGGVYGDTSESCILNGVTLINCKVYAEDNKNQNGVSGGGVYFNHDNAVANCITAIDCSADDDKGGAIYFYGKKSSLGTHYDYKDENGVIQSSVDKPCVFSGCSAKRGGGVHFFNSDGKVIGTAENNIGFINCRAISGSEYGGGLAINNGASQISYVDFTNCTSQNNGGGFGITGSCTNVSNITATDCTAKNGGGGLYLGNNSTITNVSINGHSLLQTGVANAKNGGGIFVNSGTLTLKGSTLIKNCDASSGGGGGIYVNNATAKLTEGTPNITNCTASVGGAIFATGGSTNVQISTGNITNNTATGWGGGALRLEGGANATVSGDALINGNKVTGSSGERYGGAVNIKKGKLTVSGGTISNNSVEVKGKEGFSGAIHVSGYMPASTSDEGELVITAGTIVSNTVSSNQGVYGGAITLRGSTAKASISGGTIAGNKIESTASSKNALGGAICVRDGGELTLTGGTLNNNTAVAKTDGNAKGAGIYVDDTSVNRIVDGATEIVAATLKISGRPMFSSGNNVNAVARSNYSDKLNGGEEVYTNNRARQDIFIIEDNIEGNDDNPKSIEITGDLTWYDSSSNGSIWVWAEDKDHGKQLMPFAKISDDVVVGTESGNLNPEHLKVFRNARDDEWTENGTETYLFGTNEGADPGYAYWSGVSGRRQVILQKVGQNNMPLEGAQLTVYKGNATTPYSVTQPLENLPSDKTGVFWVGELAYGTYYLQETEAPDGYGDNEGKWFCMIIDADGTFMSQNGYAGQNDNDAEAKKAALDDATEVATKAKQGTATT